VGYGAWWLGLAGLKTIRYLREGLPFNLGWWGLHRSTRSLRVGDACQPQMSHSFWKLHFAIIEGIA
jgi:hypothetical protein